MILILSECSSTDDYELKKGVFAPISIRIKRDVTACNPGTQFFLRLPTTACLPTLSGARDASQKPQKSCPKISEELIAWVASSNVPPHTEEDPRTTLLSSSSSVEERSLKIRVFICSLYRC